MADRRNSANEANSSPQQNGDNAVSDNASSVWDSAPDAPLIPYLTNDQRAELVNSKAVVNVVDMEYDPNGRFGPKFIATFIVPADESAYRFSMSSQNGKAPKDHVNKWMREQIKAHQGPIPAQLVKRGSAYFLDKPGAETETVPVATFGNGAASSTEEIPF